ncbi:MAG: hypothetical protein D3903_10070 [Candidatus Electrothrix sp. GM3_4]|nr:hypothetical protein [Candidatus Electrothrix sp. GM3_4]
MRVRSLAVIVLTVCFTCLAGQGIAKSQKQQIYPLGDIPLPEEIYKKRVLKSSNFVSDQGCP